ncbi:MAG TPA: response regulator [Candidatus Dormibacteraeota bacterium]
MATTSHVADDTIRVLFIEDDPDVAEMYKLKLELDGYAVTIVTPGEDAMQMATTIRPELVFLDTQRHEETAMATLRALRSDPSTKMLPVIILSTQNARAFAAAGFCTEPNDYVVHADLTLNTLSRDLAAWSIGERAGLSA